jgi:hypothetical protein
LEEGAPFLLEDALEGVHDGDCLDRDAAAVEELGDLVCLLAALEGLPVVLAASLLYGVEPEV